MPIFFSALGPLVQLLVPRSAGFWLGQADWRPWQSADTGTYGVSPGYLRQYLWWWWDPPWLQLWGDRSAVFPAASAGPSPSTECALLLPCLSSPDDSRALLLRTY